MSVAESLAELDIDRDRVIKILKTDNWGQLVNAVTVMQILEVVAREMRTETSEEPA